MLRPRKVATWFCYGLDTPTSARRCKRALRWVDVTVTLTLGPGVTTRLDRSVGAHESIDEQELEDLRDSFDNAAIGLHWLSADGTILRANRADYEPLGYDAEEYVGRNIANFHAEPAVINDMFECLKRGETLRDREAQLRAKDGSIRNVLVNSSVLWRDGQFVHTRCITRENTAARAREELRQRNGELLRVTEALPALAWIADAGGRATHFNSQWVRYTGISNEASLRGAWADVIHHDDRDATGDAWQPALANGQELRIEHRLRRHDGTYRWHESSLLPIRGDTGIVSAWFAISTDIQERRDAGDARTLSQARYRSIAESMPAMVTLSNADGTLEFCNERLLDYTGITREQAATEWRRNLFHPEDYAANIAEWRRKLTAGESVETEYRARRHDGAYRWHLARIVPICADDGTVVMWVGAHIDIHDRREAESAMQLSEARYRSIAESMPALVTLSDAAGVMEYCNQRLVDYVGTSREDVLAGGWRDIFHPEDYAENIAEWGRALAAGESIEAEYRARRHDGAYRWHLGRIMPILADDGSVRLWVGAHIDIHDRKEAEEEREKLLEDLSIANAAKDEFLGLVSHELKTPITTILGNAMILRLRADKIDAESRDAALLDMSTEAERLHHIIDNLLVLARLEQGQAIVSEPLLLSRMAEKLVTEHRHHFPHRTIRVNAEERMTPAGGEAVYVEQVLRNLLSNAEKYSPADNPIDVIIRQETGELLVSVIDNGAGFSSDEIEQVFAPFYRSPRTSATIGGVGIGLAVCKRLIEAQGGRVWARAAGEGGAEVGFSLPIVDDDA